MGNVNKRRIQVATVVYWLLLVYIIAAFAWWTFSLLDQNAEIHQLKVNALHPGATDFQNQLKELDEAKTRGFYKYAGESLAFLLVILVGAVYVYRSVRRQFRLQQQQQNFAMAITHELKTPIAVSRLNLETLQKYDLGEEKKRRLVQMTLKENLRLDMLINNILISSQIDGSGYKPSYEALDLTSIATKEIQQFQLRYPERLFEVQLSDDELNITGDSLLIKMVISNLLENAVKYSAKETSIQLTVTAAGKMAILTVSDRGSGIPLNERTAVFEKFYRVGNEQTRKTQGTGLGLFIVKRIVKDHKGTISIRDNQPTGTKFIVQLPLL